MGGSGWRLGSSSRRYLPHHTMAHPPISKSRGNVVQTVRLSSQPLFRVLLPPHLTRAARFESVAARLPQGPKATVESGKS